MSKYERDQERLFTRRALLLSGAKLGLLGILGARMFQLQVVERSKYLTMAEENRVNMTLIAPERGVIHDRFNVPLAVNVQDFRLLMIEERARGANGDINAVLDRLGQFIPLSQAKRKRILRDFKNQHSYLPVLIDNNLTWEQMARIEVSLASLPGVSIEEGRLRSYPLKEATAHVLGYVGAANEADVKKDPDPLLSLPGFQIGKNGLEQFYEQQLRGVAGKAEEEVNSTGRRIRTLTKRDGQSGADLSLTLDAELQLFVQSRLATERSASAVVLDAYTGAVYASCSHPAYDPNVFSRGIPYALWNELLNEPAAPLTNKVIAGQYPPGSTYKMIVALAGLEAGALSEHRHIFCPGHMTMGGHVFHCHKHGGHGSLNVIEAIARSCDVFFYQTSLDIGQDRVAAMARRFGLGSKLGLDSPNERPGLIPDPAWKKRALKQSWQRGETVVNAIGQGFTLATPLQLAVMIARMVNGGIPVKPYLAQKAGNKTLAPNQSLQSMGIDPSHLALVKAGMDAVVNGPTGTAKSFRIAEPGFEFGGKTGTSQVRRITMEERRRGFKIEDLEWEMQNHGLFAGYAPIGNPRYVCAVIVEHGGSSAIAAPIVRDILLETQKRDPARQGLP